MTRIDDLWTLAALETDECVLWPYAQSSNGYPSLAGKRGHSMVCEKYHGPCPPGLEAAHACGVRLCVNPRHLRWATHPENMQDMLRHDRVHLRKLSLEQVDEIRQRYAAGGITMRSLGTEYGVTHSAISKIVGTKTWKRS